MEKNAPSWVFPTVRNLVSLVYYFMIFALFVFVLMTSLKLVGAQLENVSFKTNTASIGGEQAGYVAIPVAWGPANTKTLTSSGKPPVFLKPQKQTGQLEVPIRSMPGILMILLGLVSIGTALWTFGLLRRIFLTVQTQSPFHPDNARRITIMGFLFLGQTMVEGLLKLALWSQAKPYFQQIRLDYQNYLSVDITLDGPWLLGLILLALAQVYRRGIEFQLEHELTV
jgi:hypothetical protein